MQKNPHKRHFTFTLKNSYAEYKGKQKELKNDYVPWQVYKDIMREVLKAIMKKIVFEDWTFYLPYRLGCITKLSFDQTSPEVYDPINRNESKKRSKKIVYFNFHSHKRVYQIKWITSFLRFKNKKFYIYRAPKGNLDKKLEVGCAGINKLVMDAARDPTKKLIK